MFYRVKQISTFRVLHYSKQMFYYLKQMFYHIKQIFTAVKCIFFTYFISYQQLHRAPCRVPPGRLTCPSPGCGLSPNLLLAP